MESSTVETTIPLPQSRIWDAIPLYITSKTKPLLPTYGKLTVHYQDRYKAMCSCSCGSPPKLIRTAALRNGRQSCGCLKRELLAAAGAARARKGPILPEFFTVTGRSVYTKYLQQERVAKDRGIAWEFSFDEWCRVWHESGKWARRGRAGDAYVMARFGDVGPYSPANVEIITLRQNSRDFQLNKTRRLSASAASFSAPEAAHT
jgi:hypothetical protein